MEHETVTVSKEEMKRFELLQYVLDEKLTLTAVAEALGVSYRQARRLKAKVAEAGLQGLGHGNRGRAPAHAKGKAVRARVLALSTERYFDFNDTHCAEMLAEEAGIVLSRETLRRWRRAAGTPPKHKHRAPKHRKRRPRKEAEGMMMLWDGSPHHWFGKEHPACCLMAAIDDATGKVLAAHCCPAETSWAYLKLLDLVLQRWGVPASIYQDRHGALRRNDEGWSLAEELAGKQDPTQVGAALEALTIRPIFALSPQAKGRVERLFGVLQDRLVAELRLKGVTTTEAANGFLESFLPAHNRRFARTAAQVETCWRRPPKPAERERILSLCYPRTVGNDNVVQLDGMLFDIPPGPAQHSYAKQRVEVRQLLDGRWHIYHQGQIIARAPATEIAELIRTRTRRKGVRAAYDDAWAFRQSSLTAAELDLLGQLRSGLPPATTRRAGPGGVIGGTRVG